MNCIFVCVFNQNICLDLFFLLLKSIFTHGEIKEDIHILVYTSTSFMNKIKENSLYDKSKIKFEINDTYDNIDKACKSRLDVFELNTIQQYEKILYLDIDIIVKNDIHKVFQVCKKDVLYALEEGDIQYEFWGGTLFGHESQSYKDKSAFSSGILLFHNSETMKDLFRKIKEDIVIRPYELSCCDQPYVVYNAFKYQLYDNKTLKSLVVNNDNNIHSDKIIHHFPGGPGIYENKIKLMTQFMMKLMNSYMALTVQMGK